MQTKKKEKAGQKIQIYSSHFNFCVKDLYLWQQSQPMERLQQLQHKQPPPHYVILSPMSFIPAPNNTASARLHLILDSFTTAAEHNIWRCTCQSILTPTQLLSLFLSHSHATLAHNGLCVEPGEDWNLKKNRKIFENVYATITWTWTEKSERCLNEIYLA